jgi:hypothetical protein
MEQFEGPGFDTVRSLGRSLERISVSFELAWICFKRLP